ncbi:MAG: hypothetical protein RLY60_1260 [Pseudomonadota bacterium]
MSSLFSAAQHAAFASDGYVLVRGLFDQEEIQLLRQAIEQDPDLQHSLYQRKDAQGKATMMATWNHPGNSVYGLAARSRRVVDTMEHLLGGEVYHYHSKLTAKEPLEGGAWEWHQDYGYWYHNGCLQVIRGSHLAGRVEHGVLPGEQVGADPARVEQMLRHMPLEYIEMESGDGLFFHCNVMHRSDQNRSPNRRWTVLFCYNAAHNNPFIAHHHPFYTPLDKVEDSAIKQAGVALSGEGQQAFMQTFSNPPGLKAKMNNQT